MQYDERITPGNTNALTEGPTLNANEGGESSEVKTTFTAHLKSRNEIPANPSNAQGQAIFQLSEDGMSLDYKLIVANIEGVTQAHIHCGASDANGPFVVFLFPFNGAGVDVNGILAEGTITQAQLIARPTCTGGFATFEQLIERIRMGTAYVNVHTLVKPGGEIRGQIN